MTEAPAQTADAPPGASGESAGEGAEEDPPPLPQSPKEAKEAKDRGSEKRWFGKENLVGFEKLVWNFERMGVAEFVGVLEMP